MEKWGLKKDEQTTSEQDGNASITVSLSVRLDEIDYLGIVHASNYLKYLEHARVKLVEQQGIDLLAWVKKGVRAVVVNDTVNYRHPARYGDVLDMPVGLRRLGKTPSDSVTGSRSGERERKSFMRPQR